MGIECAKTAKLAGAWNTECVRSCGCNEERTTLKNSVRGCSITSKILWRNKSKQTQKT